MKKTLFSFLVIATVLSLGCEKAVQVDPNSPASKIEQSESREIPAEISLPSATSKRITTLYAEGVQKYKAQLKAGTSSTYEWVFVAPKADLFDANNNKVGTHSAGPTWQLFGGSDSCFAQQLVPAKAAPSPDGFSIDWLLLGQKTTKPSTGFFANVGYVQRIVTAGGKAPSTPPVSLNDTVDVLYTAIYRFSTAN